MKETGIVRKVDELGRVVLPIELRRTLNIEQKDPLEIYVEDETIILRKKETGCIFCGSARELREYRGRCICASCIRQLSELG